MGAVYFVNWKDNMEFSIERLWNGEACSDTPIHFQLKRAVGNSNSSNQGLEIQFQAPFYDDPPPPNGKKGEAYNHLWDYEVVELFFLSSTTGLYLEVEFGPHGQHLGLLLNKRKECLSHSFPLEYQAELLEENGLWKGTVKIPLEYFPPKVDQFNAYSIHGTEPSRIYKSLYAVPGPHPDFHRLNCFKSFDLITQNEMSDFWKSHVEGKK